MTTEELMRHRYKVIADYPFRDHFLLGEIIELNEFDGRNHLSKDMQEWFVIKPKLNGTGSPMSWYESGFNKYPHIFKKLEWWEEREEKDMPGYLRCTCNDFIKFVKGQIISVEKHKSNTFNQYVPWLFVSKEKQSHETVTNCFNYKDFEPSTREEYEQYLQSKNSKP